jgi:hypothetical protein
VIGLRRSGLTYVAIAAQVGLTPTGVFDIYKRFARRGPAGLVSGKRGRRADEQRLLGAGQEAAIRHLICGHTPDEVGLPYALRSRAEQPKILCGWAAAGP